MRTVWLAIICSALTATTCLPSLAQEIAPPSFESYPVAIWRGRVAPLNLRSHSLARLYNTRIREQVRAEGVNFAGHYTLASVGCGTGCSTTAIVDARTGWAYFPNELNGWTSIVGDYEIPDGEDQRTFRAGPVVCYERSADRTSVGPTKNATDQVGFTSTSGERTACAW